PRLHISHITPHGHTCGTFRFQGLLQHLLHATTHLFFQFFFKERFSLRPVQLKMTVVEDFQFSHVGVPPPCELALQREVHPLFFPAKKRIYTNYPIRWFRRWSL